MKTIFTLLITMLLSQSFSSVYAGSGNHPFTAPSSSILVPSDLQFVNFKLSFRDNKTLLQWEMAQNELAYQFEVEKSYDGKNFSTAALVFGTDKTGHDEYMFYEKTATKKTYYRVKVTDSRNNISYSAIQVANPNK